jgi:hypothetical protein
VSRSDPVIAASAYCLAHVPDLVRYGSKPRREIELDAGFQERLTAASRSFQDAVAYPPNQTFVGNLTPDELASIQRPWFSTSDAAAVPGGPFGEIVGQDLFYAALARANVLEPPLITRRSRNWVGPGRRPPQPTWRPSCAGAVPSAFSVAASCVAWHGATRGQKAETMRTWMPQRCWRHCAARRRAPWR